MGWQPGKKRRRHHIQRQCGQRVSAQVWWGGQLQKEEWIRPLGEQLPIGRGKSSRVLQMVRASKLLTVEEKSTAAQRWKAVLKFSWRQREFSFLLTHIEESIQMLICVALHDHGFIELYILLLCRCQELWPEYELSLWIQVLNTWYWAHYLGRWWETEEAGPN